MNRIPTAKRRAGSVLSVERVSEAIIACAMLAEKGGNVNVPKRGTRLRLKKDHSMSGMFHHMRNFGGVVLWIIWADTKPGEGSGCWVFAPEEWERMPTPLRR